MPTSPNFVPSSSRSKLSPKIAFIIVVVAIAILALLLWMIFGNTSFQTVNTTAQATSQYQAVFLNNGQVYFGKLKQSGTWLSLTDVYYLQVTEPLQSASSTQTNPTTTGTANNSSQEVKLVKLGSELHGPQDAMFIDRDKILFWENLKDDSKVLDAIKRYTK